jgi:hypothetical protein
MQPLEELKVIDDDTGGGSAHLLDATGALASNR